LIYNILSYLILFFMFSNITFAQKYYDGFRNAISMTIDGKGDLYVLDNESNEIIKFNSDLDLIKRNGKKGWDNSEFFSPTGIDASYGLDLFVCDGKNYRIQRFDLNIGHIYSLLTNSETFPDNLRFNNPVASVVVNTNELFVIDGDNSRIVKFLNLKIPSFAFGGFEQGDNALQMPVKIQKDNNNNIYVFDISKKSIFVYDCYGTYIKKLTTAGLLSFTIYKDYLFMVNNKNELISYDVNKNAYSEILNLIENIDENDFKDILFKDENTFYILTKTTIKKFSLIK
jgi:hypothetical protein